MPLNSFLDKFRRPSFTSGPIAPTYDSDDRMLDIQIGRTSPGGTRIERGTNPLMRMAQPGMSQMRSPRNEMRAPVGGGNADGSPNVVYDAGTELAFKRFDEAKRQNREQERLREKQIESTAGYKNAELGIKSGGLDVRRAQVEIQRMKMENPNLIFKMVPGGNIIALDPRTAEVLDTGISSGTLSGEDKLNRQQSNSVALEGVREENRIAGDERNQLNALARIAAQNQAIAGRQQPTSPKGGALTNRAMEAIEANPQWAPFIKVDESGKVTIAQPGATAGGLNLIQQGLNKGKELLGYQPDMSKQNTAQTLDMNTWREINKFMYEPQKTGIENNPIVQNEVQKSTTANEQQGNITPAIQEQAKAMLTQAGKPITPRNIKTVSMAIINQQKQMANPQSQLNIPAPIRRVGPNSYTNRPQ